MGDKDVNKEKKYWKFFVADNFLQYFNHEWPRKWLWIRFG